MLNLTIAKNGAILSKYKKGGFYGTKRDGTI